jgi:hypothetical protein
MNEINVIEFVASDKTDYHSSQVKREVLVPMEKSGAVEVRDDTRKKKNTYPDGTILRFV